VTGNDVTWPQVTWNDPKVTSFDQKSPGSGCRRPKTPVYCTVHFLQGSSLQEEAVTWQEMTSRDLRWPEVTQKRRHLTGSHLEVAVERQKLSYTANFTSYKAVARSRRQSPDRKWGHELRLPEVTLFDRMSPGSGCRRPKMRVYCTFHFLQSCSSQEEAVTWQEMTSRDLSWPKVTRKWRHLTGSLQEVDVEVQKLAYIVHFHFLQVCSSHEEAVTRQEVTSCDFIWL